MSELERDTEILSEILAGIDPSTSPGNRRTIAERRFFKMLEQEVPAKSDLGVAGSLDTVAPQTHDGSHD